MIERTSQRLTCRYQPKVCGIAPSCFRVERTESDTARLQNLLEKAHDVISGWIRQVADPAYPTAVGVWKR